MKFIAPRSDDIPAKCNEKIAKSTEGPECDWILANGGYTVHPVPAPPSANELTNSKINEGGSSQNEMLLSRGNHL